VHPLLRRQLKKAFREAIPETLEMTGFIAAVEDAYTSAADDRRQLEHSLDLASKELWERNKQLEGQLEELRRLERVVAQRNRDMALILDNVSQGLVTVDLDGGLRKECSQVLTRWFGVPGEGTRIWSYLIADDPDLEAWMEFGFEQLRTNMMPQQIVLAQLPSRLQRNGSDYMVEYQAVGDPLSTVLIVVSDITEELARQRAERTQRELVAMVEKAFRDRSGFLAFIHESNEIIRAVEAPALALGEAKRFIHTLKGNASLFGVLSIAELCHQLEDEIDESSEPPSLAQRGRLVEAWRAFHTRVDSLLGLSTRRAVLVDWDEYQLVLSQLTEPEPSYATRIRRWGQDATRNHLERFGELACQLAHRLGKHELEIDIRDNGVRLDGARFGAVWSALVHSVRNAVDHGIESPDVRLAAGKPERGKLSLSTEVHGQELLIEIRDDGRGIDWAAVAAKATALGLPAATQQDLAEAVFRSGLSTAAAVTELSGRGVGMGALREACAELGGRVELESIHGAGTRVQCHLPLLATRARRSRPTTTAPAARGA